MWQQCSPCRRQIVFVAHCSNLKTRVQSDKKRIPVMIMTEHMVNFINLGLRFYHNASLIKMLIVIVKHQGFALHPTNGVFPLVLQFSPSSLGPFEIGSLLPRLDPKVLFFVFHLMNPSSKAQYALSLPPPPPPYLLTFLYHSSLPFQFYIT